jgi:hypothetical protein
LFCPKLGGFCSIPRQSEGSATVNTSGFDTQRFITAWDKLNKGICLFVATAITI